MMATLQRITGLIFVVLLGLTGCGDSIDKKIEQQIPITEQRIQQLATALAHGEVRNANLIHQYAKQLRTLKPELSGLIDTFEKDATTEGPLFSSLVDRLNTVKKQPTMFASKQAMYEELLNIYQAADPVLFSDALSDPLNVLADMSDGKLPRVNALPKSQSLAANKAQDFGTGEQLIGNPAYGQWQTDSNGMSFWAWYGMYSMLGDLFGSRRVYYNDWGRHRNYSYYNDYGRTRFSSPQQLKKQTEVEQRTKKSFEKRGQRFESAYARNRTGAAGISSQSQQAKTSADRFRRTGSASKSRYASSKSNNASFRNSRTNTTRSFRRGK
jgi:hypothetical protein